MRTILKILLTIFVSAGICSCRSHKNAEVQSADSVAVSVIETHTASNFTAEDFISVIRQNENVEAEDIVITYAPADSGKSVAPIPASISIGRLVANRHSEIMNQGSAMSEHTDSSVASADSVGKKSNFSKSESTVQPRASPLWLSLSIIFIIGLIIFIVYANIKEKFGNS